MTARERLLAAYEDHGEEFVQDDPELRALLAADPELQEVFAQLKLVDVELAHMPTIAMPRSVEEAILARTAKRSFWRTLVSWIPVVDAPLSFATLLLVVLSPLTLWMLVERGGGELRVLEMVPSTVSFDMTRARELQAQQGESDAGELIASELVPSTIIVPRGKSAHAISSARATLTHGSTDAHALNVQGLVNAFSYGAGASNTRVELEVSQAPWRRETLLLRVFIAAGEPLSDCHVELAFNPERVQRYRRLADSGSPGGGKTGSMATGEDFTALYELVVAPTIGEPNKDALATATFHLGNTKALHAEASETSKPSQDFRFASAVAYFTMQARGELGESRQTYERIAALAGRAIDRRTQKDRSELLALIALAAQR